MIAVQHLTERFGSHTAVDDLSFEVGAGGGARLPGAKRGGHDDVEGMLVLLAGTFVLMALASTCRCSSCCEEFDDREGY